MSIFNQEFQFKKNIKATKHTKKFTNTKGFPDLDLKIKIKHKKELLVKRKLNSNVNMITIITLRIGNNNKQIE